MSTTLTGPPLAMGQPVTIRSYEDALPGTVVGLRPIDMQRWEIRVEVLTTFGVGTSRHVVDSAGHEVDTRTEHHGLEWA